jgi:hypothetical protein
VTLFAATDDRVQAGVAEGLRAAGDRPARGRHGDQLSAGHGVRSLLHKLHVGGAVDRTQAMSLREAIFAALSDTEKHAFVAAFREGGRVLGRSFMEAPNWLSDRIRLSAERWAESGGKAPIPMRCPRSRRCEEVRWLDRAAGGGGIPHRTRRTGLSVGTCPGIRASLARGPGAQEQCGRAAAGRRAVTLLKQKQQADTAKLCGAIIEMACRGPLC